MSHYRKELQRIVREYRIAGGPWPASAKEIADWAIRTHRWKLPSSAAINVCAEDIARAMREEYMTDSRGRRVRVKHPASVRRSGEQTTLWDDIRTASPTGGARNSGWTRSSPTPRTRSPGCRRRWTSRRKRTSSRRG